MKKALTVLAVIGLVLGGIALAQEEQPKEGGKLGPGKRGGRGGMRPRMGGMGDIFKTMRAMRAVSQELTEEQKAEFDEAMAKLQEKMKAIQAEFETDLGGILTAEQMEKFKEAKDAPFTPGQGRRGRRGGGGPDDQGQGGREGGRRDLGEMFKRMDADGDGKLSKEEFRGPEQHFDQLDADKDGFISQEEIKARGGKGRGRRPEGGDPQE